MTALDSTKLFKAQFTKAGLRAVYDTYIAGGASIGRDGVTLDVFEKHLDAEIDLILRKVKLSTYDFTSYKERLISKGADKKPRQLSIPTVRDKLLLKFLARFLADIYPDQVAWVPHSIVKRVHEVSNARPDTDCYLRLDIENYYPTINHKILMRILRNKIKHKPILHLIHDAIQTPTGKQKSLSTVTDTGVPQGLSISNILASIYLADIDVEFKTDASVDYFRYVDDILVIGAPSQIKLIKDQIPAVLRKKRKLICHKVGVGGKSTILTLGEGIEYLGYKFCREKIEVRSSSLKKMFANLMKIFTTMKHRKDSGRQMWRLNLRISGCLLNKRRVGWLFFFSQTKNVQQLKQLDAFVTKHLSKVIPPLEAAKVKRFVKGFYEIKYRLDSKYFPDFDNFDDEQKRAQIAVLRPGKYTSAQLAALKEKELNELFHKCISHEVTDMEHDMMEVFS